jgi:hypothetical protein
MEICHLFNIKVPKPDNKLEIFFKILYNRGLLYIFGVNIDMQEKYETPPGGVDIIRYEDCKQ